MATTPMNRIVRSPAPNTLFGDVYNMIDNTVSWNQGDILFFDAGASLVKPVTAETDGATVLGIAQQTIVEGKPNPVYIIPAVAGSAAKEATAGPVFGVEALMKLKVGDTFTPGGDVFATAVDAQTISSVGITPIGTFLGPLTIAVAGSQGVYKVACYKTFAI